jgi:5-enolpyruvylshikimate-3-phosphate synthase
MSLSILLAGKQRTAFFSDEKVVAKSYPGFWKDLERAGFICAAEVRSADSF